MDAANEFSGYCQLIWECHITLSLGWLFHKKFVALNCENPERVQSPKSTLDRREIR